MSEPIVQYRIITGRTIITANFACAQCNRYFYAYFIDTPSLDYIGCDCQKTAVRISEPAVLQEDQIDMKRLGRPQ